MTIEAGRRRLILASQSQSRQRMLAAAGVPFAAIPSKVDEPQLRRSLEAGGRTVGPKAIALALAAAKAQEVSNAHPDALVIGGDQVLALGKAIMEKPPSVEAARAQLGQLRGRIHELFSAVVLAEAGKIVWEHADAATLTMRLFSPTFLDTYLTQVGSEVCKSVGAYQLEGHGAQLFENIEGDYFTILGMPLIALLGELRERGVIQS